MKRYDPIQHFQQGGSGYGKMEESSDGDYVREADLMVTRHDVVSVEWHYAEQETTIRVKGMIQPVGAGDSIIYLKAEKPAVDTPEANR